MADFHRFCGIPVPKTLQNRGRFTNSVLLGLHRKLKTVWNRCLFRAGPRNAPKWYPGGFLRAFSACNSVWLFKYSCSVVTLQFSSVVQTSSCNPISSVRSVQFNSVVQVWNRILGNSKVLLRFWQIFIASAESLFLKHYKTAAVLRILCSWASIRSQKTLWNRSRFTHYLFLGALAKGKKLN